MIKVDEGGESVSGPGSSADQTATLREALPRLLRGLGVSRLLDLPCGDFHWMASVDLSDIEYVGGDLVPAIVESNRAKHGRPGRTFQLLDLTSSPLPQADLVICRDCLVHLSIADIWLAVENVRRSGATYLLTTTFPQEEVNLDIRTGDWRPLNLQGVPFDFPAPAALINEGCTEQEGRFADKSLGLWRVADLPHAP